MMMKTKYLFMLIVACLMGIQGMNAQNQNGRKSGHKRMTMEELTAMQCDRIVKDLGLDDATAAKFTDVYKKYMQEMNDLRKKDAPRGPRVKGEKGKERPTLTDAEVEKIMKERFAQSRKILDIREKYYDEFRKFLSPKQVQKVYDRGQMNHGKFKKEKSRRAGMKQK